MRVSFETGEPVVQYRVQWKDGSPDTWELASNLSPDLTRDFDERWWSAARKADAAALSEMLRYSQQLLPLVVDENRRSALHFVAAVGNAECCRLLVEAGADVDLQDRDGYTPLHMAAGYMQTAAMQLLLEAGANPEIKDKDGQDVVRLVEKLRTSMPPSVGALQRRMALEGVANVLTSRLYEEVQPARILDVRQGPGDEREFLVQFTDGAVDEWVTERNMAADVVSDWDAGLEVAPAVELVDMAQFGTERRYLVQWADGSPDSWEAEENVSPALVAELRERRPELFKRGKRRGGRRRAGGGGGSGKGVGAEGGGGGERGRTQAGAGAATARGGNGSVGGNGGSNGSAPSHGGLQLAEVANSSTSTAAVTARSSREPAAVL